MSTKNKTALKKPGRANIIEDGYTRIMEIARDPKKAEALLKRAGIIIKAGKLAPEYE